MNWTVHEEVSGNPLTDQHVQSFEDVSHIYDNQNPRLLDTYVKRAQFLTTQFPREHRLALVNALKSYMLEIGASEKSFQQLEKLADEQSVAVVTGQQAGLFTGPLYSLYKALTAIGLAARLEKELGRPVVPVFWIASEDHDWGEVNHAYVLDGRDDVQRLQLRFDVPLHQMMYYTHPPQETVQKVIKAVHEVIPDGIGKTEMMDALMTCYTPGMNMSGWFARIFVRLVRDHGLVMLDPCLPGLRELVRPVWKRAIEQHGDVQTSLSLAYDEVTARGYRPEVIRDEPNTTLFYVTEGRRYVLERTGSGTLKVRGLGIEKTVDEWAKVAEENPSAFSSNVLLRPVVQDFLLPTLLYVGGPSEIAYYPLSRGVFHAHGRVLPPLLLRQRMTLYPPSVRRNMEKWGVAQEQLRQRPDLVSPVLYNMGADAIDEEIMRFENHVMERWNAWGQKFAHLGPQVKDMVSLQVQRDLAGLERLGNKTRRLLEQKHEAEVRQLRHIERWIWTDGSLQERRLCPLSVWSLCGIEALHRLPVWDDYEAPGAVHHVEI